MFPAFSLRHQHKCSRYHIFSLHPINATWHKARSRDERVGRHAALGENPAHLIGEGLQGRANLCKSRIHPIHRPLPICVRMAFSGQRQIRTCARVDSCRRQRKEKEQRDLVFLQPTFVIFVASMCVCHFLAPQRWFLLPNGNLLIVKEKLSFREAHSTDLRDLLKSPVLSCPHPVTSTGNETLLSLQCSFSVVYFQVGASGKQEHQ